MTERTRLRTGAWLALLPVLWWGGTGLLNALDHTDMPDTSDPALDIGDLYVFNRTDRVVFVMTVTPFLEAGEATPAARLRPGALYQFHMDRERDGRADAVIQVAALGSGDQQRFNVRGPLRPDSISAVTIIADGASIEGAFGTTASGGSLMAYVGAKDDPGFADLEGDASLTSVLNSLYGSGLGQQIGSSGEQTLAFADPGENDLADSNVLAIVVSVPKTAVATALGIGAGGTFYAWATASELL